MILVNGDCFQRINNCFKYSNFAQYDLPEAYCYFKTAQQWNIILDEVYASVFKN